VHKQQQIKILHPFVLERHIGEKGDKKTIFPKLRYVFLNRVYEFFGERLSSRLEKKFRAEKKEWLESL
jgi:hypothetical protein